MPDMPTAPAPAPSAPPVPDATQRWRAVLAGSLGGDEAAALLVEGRSALAAALQAPHAEDDLVDIVGRRMLKPPDARTWDSLIAAIIGYMGLDAAYYFVWAIRDDYGGFAAHTEGEARIREVVGRITGLFSEELAESWAVWLEKPGDWQTVRWSIYFDQSTAETVIHLTIITYGGESFTITASEDSLLTLAHHIVVVLAKVGVGALDVQGIARLRTVLDELEAVRAASSDRDASSVTAAETLGSQGSKIP
jgi:hypothetical protein